MGKYLYASTGYYNLSLSNSLVRIFEWWDFDLQGVYVLCTVYVYTRIWVCSLVCEKTGNLAVHVSVIMIGPLVGTDE